MKQNVDKIWRHRMGLIWRHIILPLMFPASVAVATGMVFATSRLILHEFTQDVVGLLLFPATISFCFAGLIRVFEREIKTAFREVSAGWNP